MNESNALSGKPEMVRMAHPTTASGVDVTGQVPSRVPIRHHSITRISIAWEH